MASLVSPSLCDPILVLKTFLDTIYNMTGDVPLKHLETYIIDTGTSCASWNLMEPHGTSWNLMEPHGTSWNLITFSGSIILRAHGCGIVILEAIKLEPRLKKQLENNHL